jgi:peptide-methionine (S)-S-oxide reductase
MRGMAWLCLLVIAVGGGCSGTLRAAETPPAARSTAKATFAGGCFWCMEPPFEKLAGVVSVTSGYTGGRVDRPTYEQVSAGGTGHAEAVEIVFDPAKLTYEKLLDVFWHQIDPTTPDAQFCDHGSQYRSAIFFHDPTQQRLAEASRDALAKSGRFSKPLATQIVAAATFWPAEEYHQDYATKNPLRYRYYRSGCGRDRVLEQLWGAEAAPH